MYTFACLLIYNIQNCMNYLEIVSWETVDNAKTYNQKIQLYNKLKEIYVNKHINIGLNVRIFLSIK